MGAFQARQTSEFDDGTEMDPWGAFPSRRQSPRRFRGTFSAGVVPRNRLGQAESHRAQCRTHL